MLIEQIIKQTLDLQGFRVHSVTKNTNGLLDEIRPDGRYGLRCRTCRNSAQYRDSRSGRFFRHVPPRNIPVHLYYKPRRVHYHLCKGVRIEKLPRHSVAKMFRCAWGTVASAVKTVVDYGLTHRDIIGITHIGIDEISRKRGHVYLTNVYDLHSKN